MQRSKNQCILTLAWSTVEVPSHLIAALKSVRRRGAKVISLCSGIVVLAEAGFLESSCATTHWKYFDQISSRFPNINLNQDVLFVDGGDILTAAGSAAAMDICCILIAIVDGHKQKDIDQLLPWNFKA